MEAFILLYGIDGQDTVLAWWSRPPTKQQVKSAFGGKLTDTKYQALLRGETVKDGFCDLYLMQMEESK